MNFILESACTQKTRVRYLLMRVSIRIIIPIIMDMQQKEVLFKMRLFIVFFILVE